MNPKLASVIATLIWAVVLIACGIVLGVGLAEFRERVYKLLRGPRYTDDDEFW